MRCPAAAFGFLLLGLGGLAGCLEGPPFPAEIADGGTLAELRDEACPDGASEDASTARVRVDADIDPEWDRRYPDNPAPSPPYASGTVTTYWEGSGLNHDPLGEQGCVVLDVPLSATEFQVYANVEWGEGDHTCGWSGQNRSATMERAMHFVVWMWRICR